MPNMTTHQIIETCDNGGGSGLCDDVLLLVMMQLGVVDFGAFSLVCKSWSTPALSNKNKFIMSRKPMSISISTNSRNEKECHLEDFKGRKLKTILPHYADRTCIGVTCGYLILFGEKTYDFLLVNPVTSDNLYFHSPSKDVRLNSPFVGAMLVFSPSIRKWVFVVFNRYFSSDEIWFCKAGEQKWSSISTTFRISDLHAFKEKIYAIDFDHQLFEVSLYPTTKVTLLEIKNRLPHDFDHPVFVSLEESLYVMDRFSEHPYMIQEIEFSKMEWVSCEKTGEEYAFIFSSFNHGVAVVRVDNHSQHERLCYAKMWYLFHDC